MEIIYFDIYFYKGVETSTLVIGLILPIIFNGLHLAGYTYTSY